jgi:hypothetical protein
VAAWKTAAQNLDNGYSKPERLIEFDGCGVDCTIRNMSEAGAALDVVSPVGMPCAKVGTTQANRTIANAIFIGEILIGSDLTDADNGRYPPPEIRRQHGGKPVAPLWKTQYATRAWIELGLGLAASPPESQTHSAFADGGVGRPKTFCDQLL